MQRALFWMLGLGLVFVVLATLITPAVAVWWFTPPAGGKTWTEGNAAVRWGINRLIVTQLVAFVLGAVVGLVISLRFRSRTAPARTLPGSAAAPAPVGPSGRSPTSV